jgi:hypothetical protein
MVGTDGTEHPLRRGPGIGQALDSRHGRGRGHMGKKWPRRLWWLRPNTFQADDASSVVMVDRDHLRYREGDRSLLIFQEPMADPRLVGVDRESMQAWEPPHQYELLSEADKDRIVENISRAFATRGYETEALNE